MAALFDGLAEEVLLMIYNQSDQHTLRNLRLVAKNISRVATPLAFESVSTCVFSQSLQNLEAISNSHLARHVKHVECQLVSLKEHDFDRWRHYALSRDDALTKAQLEAGWSAYSTLLGYQKSWREDLQGIIVKQCLSSLLNLTKATVRRNAWPGDHMVRKALLRTQDLRDNADEDAWNTALTLVFLEAIGSRKRQGLRPVEVLELDLPTRNGLRDLLGATRQPPEVAMTADRIARFEAILDIFKDLKELSVGQTAIYNYLIDVERHQTQELGQFLLLARDLQILNLTYGQRRLPTAEYFRPIPSLGLGPVPPECTMVPLMPFSSPGIIYPHIRSLKLTISVHGESLAHFLCFHSTMLEDLSIRNSIADDWEPVWRAIARDLKLQPHCLNISHVSSVIRKRNLLGEMGPDLQPYFRRGMTDYMRAFFDGDGKGELPREYFEEPFWTEAEEYACQRATDSGQSPLKYIEEEYRSAAGRAGLTNVDVPDVPKWALQSCKMYASAIEETRADGDWGGLSEEED